MHRPGLIVRLLSDAVQGQLSVRHNPNSFFTSMLNPQAAGPYVRLDIHWIESLPLGKADDRLEASEQSQSGFCVQVFSFHVSPPPPAGLNYAWNGIPPVRPGSSSTGSSRYSRS